MHSEFLVNGLTNLHCTEVSLTYHWQKLAEAYKCLVYMLKDEPFAYLGRKEEQDAAKMA